MRIDKIALNGWRNYGWESVEFDGGTNVVTGSNAQGKTNLLEAVYMLACGRSFRTRFDRETVGFDYPSAELLADVYSHGRQQTIRTGEKSPRCSTRSTSSPTRSAASRRS